MHRVPKLLTLSTLPMSRAVKTPRVSACEPLCARLGAGVACVPDEGRDSARTGRILGRHKNGKYAAVTRGRPVFQRHEAHAEGNDTTPHIEVPKKCKTGISPPPTGFPPKPSEAVSVGRGRATERASPAACGGTRDSSSARTTASIAFVWSAAKPLPCQMHWAGKALHPNSGQKPGPTFSYDWRKT